MWHGGDGIPCLLVPAGLVLGCQGLSCGLLESGDVSALLQVPNALIVILLWEGAMVAIGPQRGLFVLSAQRLDGLVVGLGLLPGPPCRCERAVAAGSLLEVFNSRVEVITGGRGPPSSSWAGGAAGLRCFEQLS